MKKINKASLLLGIIKRNFKDINSQCFILVYKSIVRWCLDYDERDDERIGLLTPS